MKNQCRLYTWKTVGRANWLERGISNVDAAGIVALPNSLPDRIEMPNDDVDEENEDEE